MIRRHPWIPTHLLLAALGAGPGCAEFDSIEPDQCGNGVLEPGEFCDTFPMVEGGACGAPQSAAACRPICSGAAPCPGGFRCGSDEVCRAPSGRFGSPVDSGDFLGAVTELTTADVDGDGLPDLLAFTETGLSVQFGEPGGGFADRFDFAQADFGTPDVGDVNGDGLADVLLPINVNDNDGDGRPDGDLAGLQRIAALPRGTLVLAGQADRRMVPAPFRRESVDQQGPRSVALAVVPTPEATETEVSLQVSPQTGALRLWFTPVGTPLGLSSPHVDLPSPHEGGRIALAGSVQGDTGVVVVAEAHRPSVSVVRIRSPEGCESDCFASQEFEVHEVVLDEAPRPLVDRPGPDDAPDVFVGDCNANGTADVVLYTGEGTPLAWLPGPDFRLVEDLPFGCRGPVTAPSAQLRFPLAVGDLDTDGRLDVVTPAGLFFGTEGEPAAGVLALEPTADPWTEALLVDLNRDGRLDLVAASRTFEGLDLFLNAEDRLFNPSRVQTPAAVDQLAAGDFNGDLMMDILFNERRSLSRAENPDVVSLLLGRTSGLPEEKVEITSFRHVRRLSRARWNEGDAMDDVLVDFADPNFEFSQETVLFGNMRSALFSLIEPVNGLTVEARIGAFEAGSGSKDLLTAQQVIARDPTSGNVETELRFVFGDGEGGFQARQDSDASLQACPVDRRPDLDEAKLTVTRLREAEDQVDSFLIFDTNGAEDRPAELFILRPSATPNAPLSCWWTELSDLEDVVPLDVVARDVEGNGVTDLLISLRSTEASRSPSNRLLVFWNLDPDALAPGGTADAQILFEGEDRFVAAAAPGAKDGARSVNTSVALLQADLDVALEAAVVGPDGMFLIQLEPQSDQILRSESLRLPDLPGAGLSMHLAAGDFTRDGVDDLVVTRGDRFWVLPGLELQQAPVKP